LTSGPKLLFLPQLDDLQRSRSTEIDQLNGEITALGLRYGVKTPVISLLSAMVKHAEKQNKTKPGEYTRFGPAELLRRVKHDCPEAFPVAASSSLWTLVGWTGVVVGICAICYQYCP